MKRKRIIGTVLLTAGLLAAGLTAVLLFLRRGIALPCVFHRLTGLDCPGCGNTRAVLALLQGDLRTAFLSNAMFLPEFAYIAYIYGFACVNYVKNGRFRYRAQVRPVDITALAVFVLWGVVRNIIFH